MKFCSLCDVFRKSQSWFPKINKKKQLKKYNLFYLFLSIRHDDFAFLKIIWNKN